MTEIIQPQTPQELEQYYALRYKILREPWGQPPGSEKDDKENESIHLMVLVDSQPAGVCRVQYNSPDEAQVRFMGVDEVYRRHRLGKKLMDAAEDVARKNGRGRMTLQAREVAVKFYETCGYRLIEKTFLLWNTIQHYRMDKEL